MSAPTVDLHTTTQFSVFLINKPGNLSNVCQALADAKVNLLALTMMDTTEHGVLRIVAEDPDAARTAFKALELPVTETQVLAVTLPNRPGVLADVLQRLAAGHVPVHYAYVTAGTRNGKTAGILKVANLAKAVQVLEERRPQRKTRPAPRKRPA